MVISSITQLIGRKPPQLGANPSSQGPVSTNLHRVLSRYDWHGPIIRSS